MLDARRATLATIVSLIAATGCAAPPAGRPASPGGAGQPSASAPTRVTVATGSDANNLASKLDVTGGVFASDFRFMSNSPLVVVDPSGQAPPLLAAEIPSRDRGTWTVNSDGTMATTWKIRPNALWHDQQPVTSADFAFALAVYMDEAVATSNREPERLIDRIEPLDPKAFVVHWKQVYPFADRLRQAQLEPLPEHILGRIYQGDKEAFQNASFWSTTGYVGEGPYRLAEWDKGVQLTYRAFDQFFMGRPKIDEVVFRIIADMNTVVSNLLSGTVDTSVAVALNHQAGATVKQQWERSGEGQAASSATYFRNMQVQHDPGRTRQQALLDRRVRQALVNVIPIARNRDREYRASFPGLTITATSIDIPDAMVDFTYDRCPRPENRFAGSNRGCWTHPDFERFFDVATTTLNVAEREEMVVQALRVLTEDVGVILMSYNMEIIPVRKGLVGPAPRWPAEPGNTWNVYEWRWE